MKRRNNSKKNIGLLVNRVNGPLLEPVSMGIYNAAKSDDIDLFIFPGNNLHSPIKSESLHNLIYHLAQRYELDGLLVNSAFISCHVGTQGLTDYLKQNFQIPVVSIGMDLPGIPSVIVDNKNAAREVVRHIIHVHKKNRIAFVSGFDNNIEIQERFEGYCEELRANNIEIDDRLIVDGCTSRVSGKHAVRDLMKRDVEFDAIFACFDYAAIGIIDELKIMGFDVPADKIVIGFSNMFDATCSYPPLTTMHYPLGDIIKIGYEMLHSLISGKKVEPVTMLKADLIIRQSCPCPVLSWNEYDISANLKVNSVADFKKRDIRAAVLGLILRTCITNPCYEREVEEIVSLLYDSFLSDLEGDTDNSFFNLVNELLLKIPMRVFKAMFWVNLFIILKETIITAANAGQCERLIEIFNKSIILLNEIQNIHHNNAQVAIVESNIEMNKVLIKFTECSNMHDLLRFIGDTALYFRINALFVCMLDYTVQAHSGGGNSFTAQSRLLLYVDNDDYRFSEKGLMTFNAATFLPKQFLQDDRHFTYLVRPLLTNIDAYGYIVYGFSRFDDSLLNSRHDMKALLSLHDIIEARFNIILKQQGDTDNYPDGVAYSNKPFTSEVINYINKKKSMDVTLQQIANSMFISVRKLQQQLQIEGTSFRELKSVLRTEQAIKLLQDRSLTINEITQMLGFIEPASFSKAFKAWTGMNPSDYRNQLN